jgi:hypothetical protein
MNRTIQTNEHLSHNNPFGQLPWQGSQDQITNQTEKISQLINEVEKPLWAVKAGSQVFLTDQDGFSGSGSENLLQAERLAYVAPMPLESLGDSAFMQTHGTRYPYYAGAMANGISSVEMVVALGKAGLMGSLGSAGLAPTRIEAAIHAIQQALPDGPFAINLIYSPNEPNLERNLA